jgi:predicted acetyltransferase
MVTVRPTHRRRGLLRQMMRKQLADIHAAGVATAMLWASESAIYHRFGYGQAFFKARIEIDPRRASFIGAPPQVGRTRLLGESEALDILPDVYERWRRAIPGSLRRSRLWWEERKVSDPPSMRWGGGPLFRMVLEIDGRAQGYALYRYFTGYGPDALPTHAVEVLEALGTTPVATREVWRYLFGLDLVATVRTHRLCADHPLTLMLTDPRRLRMTVTDGTWVRLVDVDTALERRLYHGEDALSFELLDPFCPWNEGVWTLEAGPGGAALRRSSATPELRLSATDLGAMYLGTVSCTSLLRAGRVDEMRLGAASRGDALFRSEVGAWCLDDF